MPGFSGPSLERKPGAYFLKIAQARYNLDLANSWMIGDRESDVCCGKAAGTRTILVRNEQEQPFVGDVKPDALCESLSGAVQHILSFSQ